MMLTGVPVPVDADSFGPGLEFAAGHELSGSWNIPSQLGVGTITAASIDDDGLVWVEGGLFDSGTTLTVNGTTAGTVRNTRPDLASAGGYSYVWAGGAGIASVSAGDPSVLTFIFSRQV